jgi:hypothetical protein
VVGVGEVVEGGKGPVGQVVVGVEVTQVVGREVVVSGRVVGDQGEVGVGVEVGAGQMVLRHIRTL